MRLRTRLAISTALLMAACDRPAKVDGDSAKIDGDVYLVTQNGDVKRAASNTVSLVRDSDSLRAGLAAVCERMERDVRPMIQNADSLSRASGRASLAGDHRTSSRLLGLSNAILRDARRRLAGVPDSVRARITPAVVTTARTNVSEHYSFPAVPPGSYFLFAETVIGAQPHVWWQGVTVKRGEAITLDLDTKSEANRTLYCGAV
jgi:hypothetical protein